MTNRTSINGRSTESPTASSSVQKNFNTGATHVARVYDPALREMLKHVESKNHDKAFERFISLASENDLVSFSHAINVNRRDSEKLFRQHAMNLNPGKDSLHTEANAYFLAAGILAALLAVNSVAGGSVAAAAKHKWDKEIKPKITCQWEHLVGDQNGICGDN